MQRTNPASRSFSSKGRFTDFKDYLEAIKNDDDDDVKKTENSEQTEFRKYVEKTIASGSVKDRIKAFSNSLAASSTTVNRTALQNVSTSISDRRKMFEVEKTSGEPIKSSKVTTKVRQPDVQVAVVGDTELEVVEQANLKQAMVLDLKSEDGEVNIQHSEDVGHVSFSENEKERKSSLGRYVLTPPPSEAEKAIIKEELNREFSAVDVDVEVDKSNVDDTAIATRTHEHGVALERINTIDINNELIKFENADDKDKDEEVAQTLQEFDEKVNMLSK